MNRLGGIFILAVACIFTTFTSCIKERCTGCGSALPSDSAGLMISFSCNYDIGSVITKSNSSIDKGIRAAVFAFSCGDNPEHYPSFPGTPVLTISDEWGNLCMNKGEYLFVPEGYYDFYSISENRDKLFGVTVSGGLSSPLDNNIDYLWASFKNSYIAVNTNICFKFRHSSVRLKIDFSEADGVKDLQIERVALAPAARGGRMVLSSGTIIEANSVEEILQEMQLSGLSAQFIMLPLSSGINIPVEVDLTAKFDGLKPESRKCKIVIPSPAGGFRGGSAYLYKAKVYAQGLEPGNAVVLDWNNEPPVNINLTD